MMSAIDDSHEMSIIIFSENDKRKKTEFHLLQGFFLAPFELSGEFTKLRIVMSTDYMWFVKSDVRKFMLLFFKSCVSIST